MERGFRRKEKNVALRLQTESIEDSLSALKDG